jgi:hypothetical protein
MNKHLLLALLFLFFTHLSIAQDLNNNKTLYEFLFGQGHTMRNFVDNSVFNPGSGFAKNGL